MFDSVVFVRGLAREQRHWGDFPERLSKLFDELPVRCVDCPGMGQAHRELAPLTIELTAAAIASQIPPRSLLISMSLGSMVGLELLRRHPDRIAALVAINTSVGGICKKSQRLCLAGALGITGALLSPSLRYREQLIFLLTSCLPYTPSTVNDWIGIANSAPPSRKNVLRQLVAASRYHWAAQEVEEFRRTDLGKRILWLCSRRDRLLSFRCSYELVRRLGGMLREHPFAGHDLALDDPSWCLEQIKVWGAERAAG